MNKTVGCRTLTMHVITAMSHVISFVMDLFCIVCSDKVLEIIDV